MIAHKVGKLRYRGLLPSVSVFYLFIYFSSVQYSHN